MDTQLGSVLTAARSVIFILPQNPRLDYVASAVSLASSLEKSGKSASVICPSPMTAELSRLVGVEKVTNRLGNRNLLIRFPGYNTQGIETVTYNEDNQKLELVVAIKNGYLPPNPAQVQLDYSGISADVVVLVGIADRSQFGDLNSSEILSCKNIAFIGNFESPSDISITTFESQPLAASCSEMVVRLIQGSEFNFDQDIASTLLYGIEAATNNFYSPATTADTFEAAAYCLRSGAARHTQEIRAARTNREPWRGLKDGRQIQPQPKKPEVQPAVGSRLTQQPQAQPVPKTPASDSGSTATPSPLSPTPKQDEPSPEWLEPKIYTGRSIV
jgi:hypothetical protein